MIEILKRAAEAECNGCIDVHHPSEMMHGAARFRCGAEDWRCKILTRPRAIFLDPIGFGFM